MSDRPLLAYATAPDAETAEQLARVLLQEKIIACANLIPGMKSLYHWQGRLEETQEIVLILKTQASLWERLSRRLTELHPYETPCLIELPAGRVSDGYARWIAESVRN